jgi:hypothetical protein
VFRDCAAIDDKVMERGLFNVLNQYVDDLNPITSKRYSTAITEYVYGTPGTSSLTTEQKLRGATTFHDLNQLFNEYIFYYFQLSSKIYLDSSEKYLYEFAILRLSLVLVFPVVLLCFYVFIFRKLMQGLLESAAASNAIMLILPQHIVKHVKLAQDYIADNYSKN